MRPRDIGTRAESALVKWLRDNGFPGAERRALRGRYDAGDVTGIPSVAVQVKAGAMAQDPSDQQVQRWLDEAAEQAVNAGATVPVLVLRRAGHADPGRWWAWLRSDDLVPLLARDVTGVRGQFPVRMRVESAAWALRAAGYGNPIR